MTDQAYAYRRPSTLDDGRLGLETSGGTALAGPAENPYFFGGFLTEPAPAAAALLAVAAVARARYYQPALTRTRDPVVTANGDRLRFESFSACCGVYARLDLLPGALDGRMHDRGTTNVDVNEPLRRALVRADGPLHLSVGPDELAVTTLSGSITEKKVPLPERWLRGFAEVQVITAGFEPRAELSAAEAARFLRSLRTGDHWVTPTGRSLRLTARAVPGAVHLAGPQRLEALTPLLPHARSLRVYGPTVRAGSPPCASAWELELPGMRLVLALSPEVRRGFSGEGAVLGALTGAEGDADLVGALLAFEPKVDVDLLAERSGLPAGRVRDALVRLGTAGRVGYDLAEAACFHRELPYDAALAESMNPRLANARGLVAAGQVHLDGDTATVNTSRVRYASDGTASCTCPWWTAYRGGRGECKHILATHLTRGESA